MQICPNHNDEYLKTIANTLGLIRVREGLEPLGRFVRQPYRECCLGVKTLSGRKGLFPPSHTNSLSGVSGMKMYVHNKLLYQ